jgi:hypothetical protein
MDPARPTELDDAELVNYGGGHPDVGDLYVWRHEPGIVTSLWTPTEDQLATLNAGGAVAVTLHTEPIPPASVTAIGPELLDDRPNRYRNELPELNDPERRPPNPLPTRRRLDQPPDDPATQCCHCLEGMWIIAPGGQRCGTCGNPKPR